MTLHDPHVDLEATTTDLDPALGTLGTALGDLAAARPKAAAARLGEALAAIDLCRRIIAHGGEPSTEAHAYFTDAVMMFALGSRFGSRKGRLVMEELRPLVLALTSGRPPESLPVHADGTPSIASLRNPKGA